MVMHCGDPVGLSTPRLMQSVSDQRKMLGGCWDPILVFERESSAYVIQGVSATVRGQAKLYGEGKPQGEKHDQ